MVHAPLSAFNSVYCTYFICGSGKTFFNNFECANTVLYGHMWGLNFSAAYLLVDFCVLIYFGLYVDKLEK
jgi:hypothetical protein